MLHCLYLGPQMINTQNEMHTPLENSWKLFLMTPECFPEFFLGECFSVGAGTKFNIESKEASVCINLKVYLNHLCIARL